MMFNDHDLAELLFWTTGAFLTTTIVFGILWLRGRERSLRDSLEHARRVEQATEIQHLVHAVDSIAVEVERISEGQRFTTQILADRVLSDTPQQKRVSSTGRVITPH